MAAVLITVDVLVAAVQCPLSQGLFGVSDSACEEACREMGGNRQDRGIFPTTEHHVQCKLGAVGQEVTEGGQEWSAVGQQ